MAMQTTFKVMTRNGDRDEACVAAIQADKSVVLRFCGATTTLDPSWYWDVCEVVKDMSSEGSVEFVQFVIDRLCAVNALVWDEFDGLYLSEDDANEAAYERERSYSYR
jgi:hypothetical protein